MQWWFLEIRYYGVIFALTLLIAFLFWQWQMKRGKFPQKAIEEIILWGVAGVVIGARLGHCLFYDWHVYSQNPMEILKVYKGGLASHGATIGLVLVLLLLAWKNRTHPLEIMDRFSFSAACGAAGVRLGNFLNSEIVGRPTDQTWGVYFKKYAPDMGRVVYRHPSQLYEFAMGIAILLILIWADRKAGKEKRPLGLLTGLFLGLYFIGRFLVEYVKEFQAKNVIEAHSTLTMGQYLSIIPAVAGVIIVFWSLTKGKGKTEQLALERQARLATETEAVSEKSADQSKKLTPAQRSKKLKKK